MRSALIVIDMQRQFTDPDGPFAVEGAADLVRRVGAAVEATREAGAPVIWVLQRVRDQVGLGRTSRRFSNSRMHAGELADLDPRLQIDSGDVVVTKRRQSAFYATDLDSVLRNLDVQRVVLAGVTTNVCVLATAIDAGARDYEVIVARDLTGSLPVQRQGELVLAADDVQHAAEAFVIHAVGEVLDWAEIGDLR